MWRSAHGVAQQDAHEDHGDDHAPLPGLQGPLGGHGVRHGAQEKQLSPVGGPNEATEAGGQDLRPVAAWEKAESLWEA